MFGLDTVKELINKINNVAKMFEGFDIEKVKTTIDDMAKLKEKLALLRYLFIALLAITLLNTILITIVLLRK